MYFVYILRSENYDRHYYGHTSDLELRLQAHNYGKVRSTKAYKPWKLIYKEKFSTKSEAVAREFFFKSMEGYRYLKENKII